MKCPNCGRTNAGSHYLVCKECIKDLIESKLNFGAQNAPRVINRIFPRIIVNKLPDLVVQDLNETFDLLKKNFATPAVVMTARVIENVIFDYYDEDFFIDNEDDDNDAENDEESTEWHDVYRQLYGFNLGMQFINLSQWSPIHQEDDEDEEEDSIGTKLGQRIHKLDEILPDDTIKELFAIIKIRNVAMHGDKRYSMDQALAFLKRVLRVIALSYNGNGGALPN